MHICKEKIYLIKRGDIMNKVIICGLDTSKLPKLKGKDIAVLMDRLKAGDNEARQLFIYSNMRLVLSVVQRFNIRKENIDDVFQVGCVGLIKAMDNFDESFGVKFSTYAVPMIIGEIRRFMRDNTSIRVSRSLRDIAYRALQVREQLSKGSDKDPSIDMIAREMDMPVWEVTNALDAVTEPISLYEPVFNDGIDQLLVMDQVSNNRDIGDEIIEHLSLGEAISKLPKREREILNLRYFLGKTQIEISNEVGISQAQVSRLEKNAIEQIRRQI